jgi:hypothetical protein
MAEEWGHFINIENNKAITHPMQSLINYRDEDDEYNFNKYYYENNRFEYHYILSKNKNKNKNSDIESEKNTETETETETDENNYKFNKNNRLLFFAYILFSICSFSRCVVNSCKSLASFVSFTSNNVNS